MLISYNWLQEYFEEKLPEPQKLGDILSTKSFEVEGIEKIETVLGEDFVIDVDVLPNRAHDCLSHLGIAREIATITELEIKDIEYIENEPQFETQITVDAQTDFCRRYVGCEIKNINITESPDELKSKMQSLGQKSINNIVDITNIVMYELGQPMHAFDVDKLTGDKITVRSAFNKEKITTLDNKDVELNATDYVIADSNSAIAIAGVKGGKKAEVNADSSNIFLESANFTPSNVRKTARRIKISTDSSKRFENEITPELAMKSMCRAIDLIMQYAATDKTTVSNKMDYYPKKYRNYRTGVSVAETNSLLGLAIGDKEIEYVLNKLNFTHEIVNPREKIVEELQNLLDTPYKYGASVFFDSPTGFDCSSLVSYVYSLVGYSIPRMSVDQFAYSTDIQESDLAPGDLVFVNTGVKKRKVDYKSINFLPGTKVEKGVDHVGIYIGEGKIIHATELNDAGVIEEEISQSERFKNIVGFGRIIKNETRFSVEVPAERLDIKTTPDLIEEIGRIYGYENIVDEAIEISEFSPAINQLYALSLNIRNLMIENGFSEIVTYSFVEQGSLEPIKPIAEDKSFLRENLLVGMSRALENNLPNVELLALDQIKLFEIGKVFEKVSKKNPDAKLFPESSFEIIEKTKLSIGVKNKPGVKNPKPNEIIKKIVEILKSNFDYIFDLEIKDNTEMVEIDLDELLDSIPDFTEYANSAEINVEKYKAFSQYPFMLRDLAVWIPKNIDQEEIISVVKQIAGDLLVNHKLFDVYEKDGKVSYAQRLVFQSHEKTLTDEQATEIMNKVTEVLNTKGWEVR